MTNAGSPRHVATDRGAVGAGAPSTEPGDKAAPKRKWKLNWATLIVGLIALAGLGGAMYPSTAAWWSQYNESKAIRNYILQRYL